MKVFKRSLLCVIILISLVLMACGTPPQPVQRQNFDDAEIGMNEAINRLEEAKKVNSKETQENSEKTAKKDFLESLKGN